MKKFDFSKKFGNIDPKYIEAVSYTHLARITSIELINEPLYFFIISFIVRCSFQICDPQHDIFQYGSV